MRRGALRKWRRLAKTAALAGLAVFGLKAPILWVPLAMYGVGLAYSRFSERSNENRKKRGTSRDLRKLGNLLVKRLASSSPSWGDLRAVTVEFYEPGAESPCIVVRDCRGGLLGLGCLAVRTRGSRDFMEGVCDAASRLGVKFTSTVDYSVEEPMTYLIVRVHQPLEGVEAERAMVHAVSEGLLTLIAAIYSQCPEADVEVLRGRQLEKLVEGLIYGRLRAEE